MGDFITIPDLKNLFDVPEITIYKGCERWIRGTSNKWINFKDKDGRWLMLSTIPNTTRKRYRIPDATGWAKYQKRIKEEQIKQERAQYYPQLREAIVNNEDLYKYYNNILRISGIDKERAAKKASKFARKHAFYAKAMELLPNKNSVGTKELHQAGVNLTKEFRDLGIKPNFSHFSTLLSKAREKGIKSILHISFSNPKEKFTEVRKKIGFSDYERSLASYYLGRPEKQSFVQVHRLVNSVLVEEGKKPVSISWLKTFYYNNKNVIDFQRNGAKSNKDFMLKYVHRYSHPFANSVWQIDGTPSQTFCWENGQWVRPYMFTVMDVHSKKIIGLSISKSEDRHAIMTALKSATQLTGQLPSELVMDNASALKTDELEELTLKMKALGVCTRFAKVGNAQDKSQIERFWSTFQGKYESMLLNYIGRGIKTNDKKRPSEAVIRANLKASQYSMNDMIGHLSQMVALYNASKNGGKSPNNIYAETDTKKDKIEVDFYANMELFYNTTYVKIARSEIKMTYKKQVYFFDVPVNEAIDYNGKQVKIKYDPEDLTSVFIYDKGDNFLTQCFEIKPVNNLSSARTEEENNRIYRVTAKNKAFESKIIDKYNQLTAPVRTKELPHILDTYKDEFNDAETKEQYALFTSINGFDASIARPLNRVNSRTEYEKSDYDKNTDLINGKI